MSYYTNLKQVGHVALYDLPESLQLLDIYAKTCQNDNHVKQASSGIGHVLTTGAKCEQSLNRHTKHFHTPSI